MSRTTSNRMTHVVSCRVSDKEMAVLRRQAMKSGLSITMLLRQCLNLPEQNTSRSNCG